MNIAGMWRPEVLTLPGGWRLRRRIDPAHPQRELVDPEGARLAALDGNEPTTFTVEHAWRGVGYGEAAMQWWALAMGRADQCAPLSVTFTGRRPRTSRRKRGPVPIRTVVTPTVRDGLWVATAPGLQFAVTCRQGTRVSIRHLEPLPGRWLARPSGAERAQ
jgi:hypothetical protein